LLTKAPYNLKIDLKAERIFETKVYKKKPKKKGGFAARIEEMQKAQQAKLDANKKKLKK